MGDRSNINIIQELRDGSVIGVNIYSHCGGLESLARALDSVNYSRLDDPSYFAADILESVSDLVSGVSGRVSSTFDEAYAWQADNEYTILVFDLVNQTVSWGDGMQPLTQENVAYLRSLVLWEKLEQG